MKKWRDWLRERWPHWRPFPNPHSKMVQELVVKVKISESLLLDVRDREAIAALVANDAYKSAYAGVMNWSP